MKMTFEQISAILEQFRGHFVRRQPAMQRRNWR
jgi:hypothetical protein